MKRVFEKKPVLFFVIPLVIFFLIGCALLYFAVLKVELIPFYGWILIGAFIIIPMLLIYGFVFGFSPGKAVASNRNQLAFSPDGINFEMVLFDCSCFIKWNSIDTIIYSDSRNEDYAEYIIFVNELPICIQKENPWWPNRLFPYQQKHHKIRIKSDAVNFKALPDQLEKYLRSKVSFEFKDSRKGTLIDSKTFIEGNIQTTSEHWKPTRNYEPFEMIYDKYNRTVHDIEKRDGAI
ncbi:hypothetical protein QG516_00260 [Pedobacter gandavensis]|uniref:hypothetical protein n=1 Tax=Pedobacter gandavensis TaxID=2679963 RepID=UPI00247AE3CE|nr:hypothetical protein [Pedobacter gandavensis]WGQ10086.1 hypothetical protein QG516_00260 [Pedobacter gandavensis]